MPDIHTSKAMEVFHVPEDQVTKEMRQDAKLLNYTEAYGVITKPASFDKYDKRKGK